MRKCIYYDQNRQSKEFGHIVEAAVTAHLDVDEKVGLCELGHEERVLTDHDRTDTREWRVVVEVDVVKDDQS